MSDYDSVAGDLSKSQDERADGIIALMIAGTIGAAVVPVIVVSVPALAAALGTGVAAMGRVYGVQLNKDEAWKLVWQFFKAAGFVFLAFSFGAKIATTILAFTGLGYGAAVAMDGVLGAAIAYAVGQSAKAYFKGERDKSRLGQVFRNAFTKKKSEE